MIFKTDPEQKEYLKTKEAFEDRFYDLMFELGLVNSFDDTYNLVITGKTNYGFEAKLYLVTGLSFTALYEKIEILQQNLLCIWVMATKPFQSYADIQIVTKPLDNEILFVNPHIRPYELYLGLNFSLQYLKINCNDYCHVLQSGATGSGKTRMFYAMITASVMSCSVNEVEWYIADVIKDGYPKFRWVKHVRYYALSIEELLTVLKYLKIKLEKRRRVMSPLREQGIATNIYEYNKTQKSKMSYCYLLIDEFPAIMPDKSDKQTDKAIKEEVVDLIKMFERVGREMGFFILNGVQKTVKDEIPSLIKSQSGLRISFRANDAISSEVIMGDRSAVGLMPRYAVYSLNGGDKNYLFAPKLTTEYLSQLLEPYIDRNFKKVDIVSAVKDYETPQPPTKVYPAPKKKNHNYPLLDTEGGTIIDC